jgi:hypothetical protein
MKTRGCLIGGVYAAIVAFCLPLTAQTMPWTSSSSSAPPQYSSGQWGGTNKGEAIHQTPASCLQKNLSMEERRALYSVIRPEMEGIGYLELFD